MMSGFAAALFLASFGTLRVTRKLDAIVYGVVRYSASQCLQESGVAGLRSDCN